MHDCSEICEQLSRKTDLQSESNCNLLVPTERRMSQSNQSTLNKDLSNKVVNDVFKGRLLHWHIIKVQKRAISMLAISSFIVAICFPCITSYRHLTKKYVVFSYNNNQNETDSLHKIFIVCLCNNGGFLLIFAITTISTYNFLKSSQRKLSNPYCLIIVILEIICIVLILFSTLKVENQSEVILQLGLVATYTLAFCHGIVIAHFQGWKPALKDVPNN